MLGYIVNIIEGALAHISTHKVLYIGGIIIALIIGAPIGLLYGLYLG
jgi:hypothetical protein